MPMILDEITARNLGLITNAAVRPAPGLTVITGETGTGKTLMLGALRLLRGDKAPKTVIGPAADECEVAGRFLDGDDEVVIRRVVDANRSRAYVDDGVAAIGALTERIGDAIAIVGQHDHLTITGVAGVRDLIDRAMGAPGRAAIGRYRDAWSAHAAVVAERDAIGADGAALERERDMLAHQVAEIDAAGLAADEEGELRERLGRLRNADAIAVELGAALEALGDDGAGDHLTRAITALERAASTDRQLDDIVAQATEAATAIHEAARDVAGRLSALEMEPDALEAAEERLSTINALKRKYGASIEEVLTFRKDAGARYEHVEALVAASETIADRLAGAERALLAAGEELREHRGAAGTIIAQAAMDELRDLGFTDPIVQVEVEVAEPSSRGADRPVVRFASDAALAPGPVSAIASGGELSRLVLALTLAAGGADAAVVAFDEIDAGIGGSTALAMGEKLARLAADRQVICVTHLPQVAAFADLHLAVTREGTSAVVAPLDEAARRGELTRMLAGLTESEKGREHADELLALAAQRRAAP